MNDRHAEGLLGVAGLGLGLGALWMGAGSGLAWFAVLPCGLFAGALVAWRRSPDESLAAAVLVAAGFVRILLGAVGLGALLLVPVLAAQVDREHHRPLVLAAAGVHLAVFAAHQLAHVLGEPFPALARMTPGEAVAGLALFLPVALLAGSASGPHPEGHEARDDQGAARR